MIRCANILCKINIIDIDIVFMLFMTDIMKIISILEWKLLDNLKKITYEIINYEERKH